MMSKKESLSWKNMMSLSNTLRLLIYKLRRGKLSKTSLFRIRKLTYKR